jgi:hypothetical protein
MGKARDFPQRDRVAKGVGRQGGGAHLLAPIVMEVRDRSISSERPMGEGDRIRG